jgi:hypothetical protein
MIGFSGPDEMGDIWIKMTHTKTMDRGFTVVTL